LEGCIVVDSEIGEDVSIGPYAHLRMGTTVADSAKVGNFVEIKKSSLGAGTKSMHLAYLGDATIGKNVNIGAGVITCNYDGVKKHPTVIEDGAFSRTDWVNRACGSVSGESWLQVISITEDVPAIASRRTARSKKGWVKPEMTVGRPPLSFALFTL
jgi:bifunctional UDP-N-acetylglucosamine pyrophosphorylase/glucosamine-1-phosphate N-acetyltransferase